MLTLNLVILRFLICFIPVYFLLKLLYHLFIDKYVEDCISKKLHKRLSKRLGPEIKTDFLQFREKYSALLDKERYIVISNAEIETFIEHYKKVTNKTLMEKYPFFLTKIYIGEIKIIVHTEFFEIKMFNIELLKIPYGEPFFVNLNDVQLEDLIYQILSFIKYVYTEKQKRVEHDRSVIFNAARDCILAEFNTDIIDYRKN